MKVIVLGAGGGSRDIVDAMLDVGGFEPLGYLDDDPAKSGTLLGGHPVLGPLSSWRDHDAGFVAGLNGHERTGRKAAVLAALGIPESAYVTVIHPTASISRTAEVGRGSVILQNVTINAAARVGDHVMVLPNSVISHDAVVDDYCCLAPGAVLAGYAHVDKGAYIGARAAVKQRVSVGEGAVVGMGSVVLHDVPAGATVYGVPAH